MADENYLKVVQINDAKDEIILEAKRERYVGEVGDVGYLFQFKAKVTKVGANNYKVQFTDMMMHGINGSDSGDHKLTGVMGVEINGQRYMLKDWDQQGGYYAVYNWNNWRTVDGLDASVVKQNLTRDQVNSIRIYVEQLGCNKWTIYNYMTITDSCAAGFYIKSDGSFVMIGGEKYYPVIGNGSGVDRYNIQIGSEKY